MLKGPDISKWQGVVDFNLLKDTVDFVIARASYGTGYKDAQFDRNRDELRRLGIPCGWYHYSYPQYNTPEAEADWFMSVVGTPQDGELMCLDFEESFPTPVDWSLRFLNHLSSHLNGYKPLVYLNMAIINANNWKPVIDGNYGLWLAKWDYNANSPTPSTPWPNVAIRQWSNQESFAGISGNVDANVFYGDKSAFFAYGYHAVNQPPQSQDAEIATILLKEFKDSHGFGNLEGTVRALIGAYNDLEKVKEEYRIYREGEAERIKIAVDLAVSENDKIWQEKLRIANEKIAQMETNFIAAHSVSELFSMVWKKFWALKKGV